MNHRAVKLAFVLCLSLFVGTACSSAPPPTPDLETGSVSDALVTATGVDYAWARPSPTGLRTEGYTFASRYLSHATDGKNLTNAEATQLWAAGVYVVANWEYSGYEPLDGYGQGVSDAQAAQSEAVAAGMPAGRPIYFSVDFDATPGDQPAINAYFDGVASVLGRARTGAYGGYWVIKHLFDAGKINWGWQTYAWSGGLWDTRAQLRQVLNGITAAGDPGCCDKDQAVSADFGQWHPSGTPPVMCVNQPGVGNDCGDQNVIAGGVATSVYHCNGPGAATLVEACAHGCLHEPVGIDDACNHAVCVDNPGVGNNCGATSPVLANADPRFLYRCNGAGPATVLARCDKGCHASAPGFDDYCN